MSEKKSEIERFLELLAYEQTLIGRYHGHRGQAKVAQAEADYCEKMLDMESENIDEEAREYWEKKYIKAKGRVLYHKRMAEEARKALEEVRKEIEEIKRRRRI